MYPVPQLFIVYFHMRLSYEKKYINHNKVMHFFLADISKQDLKFFEL